MKKAGFEVVDVSKKTPLPDQIEAILGDREVDCGVDCVGFERMAMAASAEEDPAAVLNALLEVVRAPAGIGILGIYTAGDTQAKTEAKQGVYGIEWGKQWVKSPSLTWAPPVMKYNRGLMMAILWGRLDYLGEVMNVEVIPLEKGSRPTDRSTKARPRSSSSTRTAPSAARVRGSDGRAIGDSLRKGRLFCWHARQATIT